MKTRAYTDTSLPFGKRAEDLVSHMTLQEKVSQMMHDAPAIDRLGIPGYNWWNECLHGVARAGIATVFPQSIGIAATWDTDLVGRVATAISDEARAKHHEAVRQGDFGIYRGLTFWSPNINILRDPRWGRSHETYGEDPFLTGKMGVAFVRGLQGDHPKYLKLIATPKHFAVHSGPEGERHTFNVEISKKDLHETYLVAFRECVKEAGAASIMTAYNRIYGEPCTASKFLMQDILRDKWGFEGYVVSDGGAIEDIHQHHNVTVCAAESAAISLRNGCDLECGCVYADLLVAVEKRLISEEEIDRAVIRLFTARFKLGMFDPPEAVPYTSTPYEVNDCEEHRHLAHKTALESIVLLKNENKLLPLSKSIKSIAVIGPNADALDVLLGNYNGTPSRHTTPLAGIRQKLSPHASFFCATGCKRLGDDNYGPKHAFSEAISAAVRAEVVVMCLGLSPAIEGEEGDAFNADAAGDRIHIDLPQIQELLLKEVCATGKPVVLVMMNGSAIALNWAQDNVPAIIEAWYPGEEGGRAIADVLFGDYSPAGRLPLTFVRSTDDLPPFNDYSMSGRTYRYMDCEPLYPFGFGLSYTSFEYSGIRVSPTRLRHGDNLDVSVTVKNVGEYAGDEVVQLYISLKDAPVHTPGRQLAGFKRIYLDSGESKHVEFTVKPEQASYTDDNGDFVFASGKLLVSVGGSQGDPRSLYLGADRVLTTELECIA